MLEAEISVDGDVYVEGHHVGQLAGFRFAPDQSAEGPDAKAVLAAAQKALGLEYEARAARLHASGNGDFALGSDGLVRWLGDPVAKLAASDSIMRPRVIVLADDHLAGSARDFVTARIERFVNHHISTVLKPLDDLSRAEDIEGLAKGLAFQIVESLGVLFRRDVADDVKALDQDARASLRRYGVRFGAYHIFMPALLKPAPAEQITLLWALKNDAFDKPGYGDLIAMLAAGRTSIVTDPSFERNFYRLAGFRFLGKRAVRIDILERLSDLIRPALQWNPGSGPRPDGGYDGRRFTTTPAMLSILGATQDDIEEILKGLGYRADSVPAEEAAAHIATLDGTPAAAAEAPAEAASQAPAAETKPEGDMSAEATEAVTASADATQSPSAEEVLSEPVQREVSSPQGETGVDDGPSEVPAASESDAAGVADAAASEAEEAPKPVLLWRPLGRGDHARGRHQQRDRHGNGEGRGPKRQGDRSGFKGAKGKGPKPGGHGHRDGQGDHGGRDRSGGFKGGKPPRREKPIDPDSPFAKLAALKEQLKK